MKTPAHPCQAKQWCGNRHESGTTQEQASSWSSGLGTVLLPPHRPSLVFTPSHLPEATLPPLGDPALAPWRGCISWQLRCDSSPAVINLLVRAVFPPRRTPPISSKLPPGWNLNFLACRKRLAPIWALTSLLIGSSRVYVRTTSVLTISQTSLLIPVTTPLLDLECHPSALPRMGGPSCLKTWLRSTSADCARPLPPKRPLPPLTPSCRTSWHSWPLDLNCQLPFKQN